MPQSSTVSRGSHINEKLKWKQLSVGLLIVIVTSFSTGCASLNSMQRSEYQSMKLAGLAVEEKNPVLATALGVLPGGGSFYTRQWGLGVADFLLWPTSILWDPFAGHSGAEVINYDITKAHLKQVEPSGVSISKTNQLSHGMSPTSIKAILGEPSQTQFIGDKSIWKYSLHQDSKGHVPFYLVLDKESQSLQEWYADEAEYLRQQDLWLRTFPPTQRQAIDLKVWQ